MSHGRLRGAALAVIIIACLAIQCSVSVSGLVVGERMSYVVQLAGIPVGEQLVAVSE